ncbi:MAG: hypothetical protein KBA58_04565 [Methanomassiliicoccales archaeon]|nr:hypothetical protein [Methanomassiliicoccales archaeon]
MDLGASLTSFIEQVQGDPLVYSVVFFIYIIAATLFLPIPVELLLFLSPATPFVFKAILLGVGKAVGSIIVFYIGMNVERPINTLTKKWGFFRMVVNFSKWLVDKLGYLGLYLILSVPIMVDTVPVYLFSIFRKDRCDRDLKLFALTNLAAGITRAGIVYFVVTELGWNIF